MTEKITQEGQVIINSIQLNGGGRSQPGTAFYHIAPDIEGLCEEYGTMNCYRLLLTAIGAAIRNRMRNQLAAGKKFDDINAEIIEGRWKPGNKNKKKKVKADKLWEQYQDMDPDQQALYQELLGSRLQAEKVARDAQ